MEGVVKGDGGDSEFLLLLGIQSDSAESTKSVAERVRMAEEMKKLTDVDGSPRVTLTSSQSFNYPSRGEMGIL